MATPPNTASMNNISSVYNAEGDFARERPRTSRLCCNANVTARSARVKQCRHPAVAGEPPVAPSGMIPFIRPGFPPRTESSGNQHPNTGSCHGQHTTRPGRFPSVRAVRVDMVGYGGGLFTTLVWKRQMGHRSLCGV